MPRITNWSKDREHSEGTLQVWNHNNSKIDMVVQKSGMGYEITARSPNQPVWSYGGDVQTKERAMDIAREWMRNHPNP